MLASFPGGEAHAFGSLAHRDLGAVPHSHRNDPLDGWACYAEDAAGGHVGPKRAQARCVLQFREQPMKPGPRDCPIAPDSADAMAKPCQLSQPNPPAAEPPAEVPPNPNVTAAPAAIPPRALSHPIPAPTTV